MADTFTTNLNLTKPEVGASTDTWGTKLNADLDSVDGLFNHTPALLVAKGGTGANTAALARTNLGCGTIATQNASAVAITGGAIDGTPIGAATPSTVKATTVTLTTSIVFPDSTSQVTAAGSFTVGFQTLTAGNTWISPTYSEHNLLADATGGATGVFLFAAAGNAGRKVQVKKIDATANPVTIGTVGGNIDGASTGTLYRQYDAYTFISDGTNWWAF